MVTSDEPASSGPRRSSLEAPPNALAPRLSPLAPRFVDRSLAFRHCRLSDSHWRLADGHCRAEMLVGGPAIRICVSPQGISVRQYRSAARRFPLPPGNAHRRLGSSHCRSEMPIASSPIPIAGRKCSSATRLSPWATRPSPLADGNAHRRLANGHRRRSHSHWRAKMLFGTAAMSIGEAPISMATAPVPISGRQWQSARWKCVSAPLRNALARGNALCRAEMRFGKPAMPVAAAPMDIREERMRISATEISFDKAPTAV